MGRWEVEEGEVMGMSIGRQPIDPYLKRWMVFVDGENMTIRGRRYAEKSGMALTEGPYYKRDVFLWPSLHRRHATATLTGSLSPVGVQAAAERAFYYTSEFGDIVTLNQTREALWQLGFTPEVFKKGNKQDKAKGVDIALTKDLLSNAFLGNFDVAVVISGDADFQPVISELKRLGKTVCLMAFTDGGASISLDLKLSADYFFPLEPIFDREWKARKMTLHADHHGHERNDSEE